MKYSIIQGTDWRGDATFNVYDHTRRITIGPLFYAQSHAQDYIEALTSKGNDEG